MSLNEKLDAIRAGANKRFPAETLAMMHRATDELRASGILDLVVNVGDRLPGFSLKNADDITIQSTDLLAEGPIILTVFRGSW